VQLVEAGGQLVMLVFEEGPDHRLAARGGRRHGHASLAPGIDAGSLRITMGSTEGRHQCREAHAIGSQV
jgi:hypothetical protein